MLRAHYQMNMFDNMGKRRRGRPGVRWEDHVKRYLKRMVGEWRITAKDISWTLLTENTVRENRRVEKERKNKRGRRKGDSGHSQPLPCRQRGEQLRAIYQVNMYDDVPWYRVDVTLNVTCLCKKSNLQHVQRR